MDYDTTPQTTGPVPAFDAITQGIIAFKAWMHDNRRPMPSEVPIIPQEAAKWWMRHQRPADNYADAPREVNTVGGGKRWEQPYVLRTLHNFRAYCLLSDTEREIVRSAVEDGVFWNGDTILNRDGSQGDFMTTYDETLKMREMGVRAYVLAHIPKMKAAIEGVQV